MGLLDLLLGKDNQFSQFADQNTNTLGAIGAGIAQGPTFSQGLANAAQGVGQGRQLDRQAATALQSKNATVSYLKAKYPDLSDAVAQGLPVTDAWTEALRRDAEAQKQTVVNPGDSIVQNGKVTFAAPMTPKDAPLRSGLSTVPMRDPKTGKLTIATVMTDGTLNFPDSKGFEYDPGGLAFDRSSNTALGTQVGGAEASIPNAILTAQNTLDTIEKAKGIGADGKPDPRLTQGMADTFGTYGMGPLQIPDQIGYTMPGSAKQDYQTVTDQLKGQAFLQAYSTLKGAGAISDAEGQKAGDAIARLSTNQSGPAFIQALNDLEAITRKGLATLKAKAALQARPVGGAGVAPPADDVVDYRTFFGGK